MNFFYAVNIWIFECDQQPVHYCMARWRLPCNLQMANNINCKLAINIKTINITSYLIKV